MALVRQIKNALAPLIKRLYWIPDKYFLSMVYFIKYHRKLNLKNPQRFTEWMQWYKINDRNPIMLNCTDKYKVRQYVESKGLGQYLNELYQVSRSAQDIDFKSLPEKFVIKTTDGGNGDNVFICRNKSLINKNEVISLINSWQNKHYELLTREWAYTGASDSKVIVEKYLEDKSNLDGSIDDYKFLCFNGKFKVLWIDRGRYSNHRRGFWNEDLVFMNHITIDYPTFDIEPSLPCNIQEMVKVAEKLSEDFQFARVDLYNISGRIIFGEITFYPFGGFGNYNPDSFDFELGSYFVKI